MKSLKLLPILILFTYLTGCSSLNVSTDWDRENDFSRYKTFSFYKGNDIESDALAENPLIKKRVISSLGRVLKAKGFKKVEGSDADIIIAPHASTSEKINITNTNYYGGYGWYSPWWGGYSNRVDISYYTEGSLVIDIADAKTKEFIWRGIGTKVLREYSNQEDRKKALDEIVSKILEDFPPNS
jgi:hypothetical protein